jgi:hypothetical protein
VESCLYPHPRMPSRRAKVQLQLRALRSSETWRCIAVSPPWVQSCGNHITGRHSYALLGMVHLTLSCWVHSDGKKTRRCAEIEGIMRMGEWRYNSKRPLPWQRLEVNGKHHTSAAVDLVKVLPFASEWESEQAPEPVWRRWPATAGNRNPVGNSSRHYTEWASKLKISYFLCCLLIDVLGAS